jgi:cytochrome c oxidase assembly protein subunit 11
MLMYPRWRVHFRQASFPTVKTSRDSFSKVAFKKNKTAAYYSAAVLVGFLGLTYAAVPIYRVVCQKTGWGGTPMTDKSKFSVDHMVPVSTVNGRRIKVSFSASTSDTLPWSFNPQQREISVLPGETALAFYKAKNKSNEDVIGIATYNVPSEKESI